MNVMDELRALFPQVYERDYSVSGVGVWRVGYPSREQAAEGRYALAIRADAKSADVERALAEVRETDARWL